MAWEAHAARLANAEATGADTGGNDEEGQDEGEGVLAAAVAAVCDAAGVDPGAWVRWCGWCSGWWWWLWWVVWVSSVCLWV